jgi:DNA-binding response OmpR family regulator
MRLLLVEDSRRLQRSLGQGLARVGYTVDVAGDGQEALRLAGLNSYDFIVLDLMLPLIDGHQVLRQLRQEGHDTHVLVLTARDTLDEKLRSFGDGADDFMIKPFAFDELVARLAALGRRRSGQKNPRVVVGDLVVDTSSRLVTRDGAELVLPAREYGLLVLLATRTGGVVSRSEVEAALYDGKDDTTSNAVDAAIYGLRSRLDRPGEPSYIETRRGLGWVLRKPGA